MSRSIRYDEYKLERLKNKEYAQSYLQAALEAYQEYRDRDAFLNALRDLAEAQGGVPEIARRINKPKQSVYKALSEKGNPRLDTLDAILNSLGFRISIEPIGPLATR
ncbi:MAG: DNA-binding protein [bacterium]